MIKKVTKTHLTLEPLVYEEKTQLQAYT